MYQHWVVRVVRTREGNYSQASGSNIYTKKFEATKRRGIFGFASSMQKIWWVGQTFLVTNGIAWGGVSRYQQLFNINDNDERGFPWSPSLHSTCRAVC